MSWRGGELVAERKAKTTQRGRAKARPQRSSTAITIHDVARRAGVATSTVSRALNGDGRIAEATRNRVREVAREMGYNPSRSARALRSAHTRTLGYIAPDFANPVTLTHVRAAVRAAYEQGYTIFVSDAQGDATIFESQVRRLIEHRVDGILFGRGILPLSEEADALLASAGIPMEPELSPRPEGVRGIRPYNPYRERADIERGASLVALKQILDMGHRRIAYFSRPGANRTYMGDTRLNSTREAVARAGLEPEALIEVRTTPEGCVGEVQLLASSADPPTAIVCGNGVLTPEILRGVRLAGWEIPRDVSFLTYGDSVWHESYNPPLAVIRHDYAASGERGIVHLIARAQGQEDVPELSRQPAEFLARGSIAPPPARP